MARWWGTACSQGSVVEIEQCMLHTLEEVGETVRDGSLHAAGT